MDLRIKRLTINIRTTGSENGICKIENSFSIVWDIKSVGASVFLSKKWKRGASAVIPMPSKSPAKNPNAASKKIRSVYPWNAFGKIRKTERIVPMGNVNGYSFIFTIC